MGAALTVLAGILVLAMFRLAAAGRPLHHEFANRAAAVDGEMVDVVGNMSLVWSFCGLGREHSRLDATIDREMSARRRSLLYDHPKATSLVRSGSTVAFEDVAFCYPDGRRVFTDFSLHIASGQRAGLVGQSGCGKSTLFALLQRFYDVQGERILLGGQDIAGVTSGEPAGGHGRCPAGHIPVWRSCVCYMPPLQYF